MSGEPPRIGRYELLRRIGRGGMASVYLARIEGEAGFSRIYALKVMHPELASDPALVTMMLDEARLAARLTHPNTVSTLDVGVHEGAYFIAMEYVDGIALDRLLRRKPGYRPHQLLVPIAIDALRGLGAAHMLEGSDGEPLMLVHRDVTPGNILVGVDGVSRIADFGIAKARARATKTNPGIVKGKAGYVAPEVALGRPTDARADVFSMGVLLWNALTGETLYDVDNLGTSIHELMTKTVPPPSTVGLKPNPLFDHPILTALSRDPDERHSSANELADALVDALMMAGPQATRAQIGEWVEISFASLLAKRRELSDPELRDGGAAVGLPPAQREDETRRVGRSRRESGDLDSIDIAIDDGTIDGIEDEAADEPSAATELWDMPEELRSEPPIRGSEDTVPAPVELRGESTKRTRASSNAWLIAASAGVLVLAAVLGILIAFLIRR
ncbi:MAG: serine/threonine-protein kinase [Sandaracinaceae bacterium]